MVCSPLVRAVKDGSVKKPQLIVKLHSIRCRGLLSGSLLQDLVLKAGFGHMDSFLGLVFSKKFLCGL